MPALAQALVQVTARPLREESGDILGFADVSLDSAQGELDLATLWQELVDSRSKLCCTFFSDERCYTVVGSAEQEPAPATRQSQTRRTMLERVLLDGSQKRVAYDFQLSPSTVATRCRQALQDLGVGCGGSRVPLIVVLAFYAFRDLTPWRHARASSFVHAGRTYRLVDVARPDAQLSSLLSPAQRDVLRLFIEGKSHATIAKARRTSKRTIANQLASIFETLGVSGRCELLKELARWSPQAGPSSFPVFQCLHGTLDRSRRA